MEPINTNQPMQSTSTTQVDEKSIGPAIGIIVIIAVIILGSLYFWGQRIDRQKSLAPVVQESTVSTQNSGVMMQVNTNEEAAQTQNIDNLTSIEAELNATDVNSVDPGVSEINAVVQ